MPPSTSLREARRAVSTRSGVFLASTATSGTVSSLTDTKHPVRSSNIQDDLFVGKWILRPDATQASDRVRVVAENGYTPVNGIIQPDSDWSAPPSAGEVYEIHGSLEPWDEVNSLVNDALLRCFLLSEIPVAAVTGATRHGLNVSAPWLQTAGHVRRMGYLNPGESRNAHDPYRRRFHWEAVDDEGTVYVEHGPRTFDLGETLFVVALKPAYYACRDDSDGFFGERSGLAADGHQAPVAGEWLLAASMIEYWDRVAGQLPETEPQARAALDRLERWSAVFDTLTAKYLRLPPRNDYQRLSITGMGNRW
jgi:hypothetical protein